MPVEKKTSGEKVAAMARRAVEKCVEQGSDVIRRGIRMVQADLVLMRQVVSTKGKRIARSSLRHNQFGSGEMNEAINRMVEMGRITIEIETIDNIQYRYIKASDAEYSLMHHENEVAALIANGKSAMQKRGELAKSLKLYFERNPWWYSLNDLMEKRRRRATREKMLEALNELMSDGTLVASHAMLQRGKNEPYYRLSRYAIDGRSPLDRVRAPNVTIDATPGVDRAVERAKARIVEVLYDAGGTMKKGYIRQVLGSGSRMGEIMAKALAQLSDDGKIKVQDVKNHVNGRWATHVSLVEPDDAASSKG